MPEAGGGVLCGIPLEARLIDEQTTDDLKVVGRLSPDDAKRKEDDYYALAEQLEQTKKEAKRLESAMTDVAMERDMEKEYRERLEAERDALNIERLLACDKATKFETERDEARAALSKLKAAMSEGLRQEQKLIQRSEDEWNDKVKELEAELKERNQEIAAINTGIRNEFTIGEPSGDVLQDFATFVEHHKQLESEAAVMREALIPYSRKGWINVDKALSTTAGKDFLAKMKQITSALRLCIFQLTEVSKACTDVVDWDQIDGDSVNHALNESTKALKGDSTP